MYVARFSYDVLPVNRQQALDFIRRELQAAQQSGLTDRILVPLTRGHGDGAALQFEVELASLDQPAARSTSPPPSPARACARVRAREIRLRLCRK
jgi:hypothetical protein